MGAPRPRYQLSAKYTQRSRQARRMDPAMYTTHIDGRAAEFMAAGATAAAAEAADAAAAPSPSSPAGAGEHRGGIPTPRGGGPTAAQVAAAASAAAAAAAAAAAEATASVPPQASAAGWSAEIKNPTWLQRQMDQAKEWERLHVPAAPPEEEYQWRRATNDIFKNLRERRQQRVEGVGGE